MMIYYDLLSYAKAYSFFGGNKEKHFDKVSVLFHHLREGHALGKAMDTSLENSNTAFGT